jgi:two-component system chemotaxis response regulator CheB
MARRFSTSFDTEDLGPPSGYTCPDCNGSLQAVSDGNFRCHVGHAWTAGSLLQARDDEVERALWVAVRSLQEKSKLARKMADTVGTGALYQKFRAQADEAERAVEVLGQRLAHVYPGTGERGAG